MKKSTSHKINKQSPQQESIEKSGHPKKIRRPGSKSDKYPQESIRLNGPYDDEESE